MAKRIRTKKKKKNPMVAVVILLILAVAVLGVLVWQLWPTVPDDPTPDDPVTTVTTDALNARSGPGTQYEVLTVLPANQTVEVLEIQDGWCRISLMGDTAYISAEYVIPADGTTASTTTTTTVKPTTTTTENAGITTSPHYADRFIDEDGMLQFQAADNYVQKRSYPDAAVPWNLLLVNDWNPMEKGYDGKVEMANISGKAGTKQVDARMLSDLKAMLKAGAAYDIGVQSAYRPYATQERLYWAQVDEMRGAYSDPVVRQTKAGEVVKRPGFSEHNTGLAVDLYGSGDYSLTESFASTPAYQWLVENCADYGFILRFPKGKEAVTGVVYEAWHFRYVGDKDIAHRIMDEGLCLEEYLQQTGK